MALADSRTKDRDETRPPAFGANRTPAIRSAPTAPTLAASVGVATPARIEPSTATIRMSGGGNVLRAARRTSARLPSSAAGMAGALPGDMTATKSW